MRRKIAALGALCLAFAFNLTAQAQTANLNPVGIDPEHYQCYTIGQTAFPTREVRLRDQFGLKTVKVIAPRFLCTPVSKNGALLADTKSHLVCYQITGGLLAGKKVEIVNQFGKLEFGVNTANLLCVPSTKRVLPQ